MTAAAITEQVEHQNLVCEVTFVIPFTERILLLIFGKLAFRIRVVVPDWFERAYLFLAKTLSSKP